MECSFSYGFADTVIKRKRKLPALLAVEQRGRFLIMKVSEGLRGLGEEERGRLKVDLGTLAEAHLLPLAYAVLLPLLSNMRGISTTNDMWDSDVDSHDSMRENPSRG